MLFYKKNKDILNMINKEHKIFRFIQFLIGVFIISVAFNLFILPCNLVYGVSGMGVMLKKLYNINPSVVILIGNAFLLLVSLVFLGSEKTKHTILGAMIYPIMIALTAWVPDVVEISMKDTLVVVLFGAVISGFGYGLIFKAGYTTGGTDILNEIVVKYAKTSMGNAMLFVDGFVLMLGVFVFGFTKIMYSIIALYIISLMTDKVMIGISSTKSFFIITSKEKEVKDYILNEMGHGVTSLEGKGAFSGNKQAVLMCVIPTKEYFLAKEGIHTIDKNAFFVVADAYEVYGNK